MNILIITGSTSEPSNSEALADAFLKGIKACVPKTEVQKIRLKDISLKHFGLDCYQPGFKPEADFADLENKVKAADGLVIATPIWNFGVPAQVKNMIDRIGSFALDDKTRSKGTLNGKPFFLIFTGGATYSAWLGLMRFTTSFLPVALQYYGASHFGSLFEGRCVPGRGQFGLVVNQRADTLKNAEKKGQKFAAAVTKYLKTGQAPFYYRLKYKSMKWGEKLLSRLG